MKATLRTVLDVLGAPEVVYETPIFQRVYSWTERQCEDLWNDILAAGRSHNEHFMGSMLYGRDDGDVAGGSGECVYDLIDGQQRAVTMTLLLTALRDHYREAGAAASEALAVEGPLGSAEGIQSTYLTAADGAPKLRISDADVSTLALLVKGEVSAAASEADGAEQAGEDSELVVGNERFFAEKLAALESDELPVLVDGLRELVVVGAELETDDQPQLVFETLNSRGMSLSTTDLIRNLLLSHYDYEQQSKLFEQYWQPVQALFFDDEERLYEDAAVYAWLKTQVPDLKVGARSELYQTFKDYVNGLPALDVEALLASLSEFCHSFMANLKTPQAKDAIDWALGRLQGLVSERKLFEA